MIDLESRLRAAADQAAQAPLPELPEPLDIAQAADRAGLLDVASKDASADTKDAAAPPVPVFPPSAFVGTWRLGPGGGTQSCQYPLATPTVSLPAMTLTITQPQTSTLGLATVADDPSNQSTFDDSLPLAITGTAASGYAHSRPTISMRLPISGSPPGLLPVSQSPLRNVEPKPILGNDSLFRPAVPVGRDRRDISSRCYR